MSNFPIVATVLSMILGLSVTRLLLGALTVFRIRRTAKPDWVALVWAAILFRYSWTSGGLSTNCLRLRSHTPSQNFYCSFYWRYRFLSLPPSCYQTGVKTSKVVFEFTSSRMADTHYSPCQLIFH